MLDVLLWVAAGMWGLCLAQAVLNWIFAPDLRCAPNCDPCQLPSLSIVVPARDEEAGIEAAVRSFCGQDYPDFEVVVVDDGSTDGTSEILDRLQEELPALVVVEGSEPPDGWMGKVNALEIGRRRARGDWLLFVDADVVYHPNVARHAVTLALEEDAGMVVVGPHFVTQGAVEAAIMSHLYLVAMALVPTWLVSRTRNRFLALGGGVFNLVKREALTACGAFASLKSEVVDDVALGIFVKGAGYRLIPAFAGTMVSVRMYDGAWATVRGFTKNIFPAIMRTSYLLLLLPILLGGVMSLLPYAGLIAGLSAGEVKLPAVIALALMHVTMGAIAFTFRQPWPTVFLTPVRELAWWLIIARGFIHYRRGGVVWRGRSYPGSSRKEPGRGAAVERSPGPEL